MLTLSPNEQLAELIAARLAKQNLIPSHKQDEVQRKLEAGSMTEQLWLNYLLSERDHE